MVFVPGKHIGQSSRSTPISPIALLPKDTATNVAFLAGGDAGEPVTCEEKLNSKLTLYQR